MVGDMDGVRYRVVFTLYSRRIHVSKRKALFVFTLVFMVYLCFLIEGVFRIHACIYAIGIAFKLAVFSYSCLYLWPIYRIYRPEKRICAWCYAATTTMSTMRSRGRKSEPILQKGQQTPH
jgi:hypothetical protein